MALAALCVIMPLNVSAKTGDRYRLDEEGHWIAVGGINTYDEIKAVTREDTARLEETLINDGYILITGDNMAVPYEDYEQFKNSRSFWFSPYMENQPPDWNNYKVYVFGPSYRDYMEQINSDTTRVKQYLVEEINNSTVVIDFKYWNISDAVGTISDEINGNIPEYCERGYMEIISTVDCEVTLLQAYSRRFHKFYIRKNQPFMVKVIAGCYHIIDVNNREIPDNINNSGEDTLPYNNQIQIGPHHTADNPYIIELGELVLKYDIPDMDISGKPDLSVTGDGKHYEENSIAEESTIVSDNDKAQPDETAHDNLFLWCFLIILAVLGVIYVIIQIIRVVRETKE